MCLIVCLCLFLEIIIIIFFSRKNALLYFLIIFLVFRKIFINFLNLITKKPTTRQRITQNLKNTKIILKIKMIIRKKTKLYKKIIIIIIIK